MDKNAIKKFAIWARSELMRQVAAKMEQYAITADADADPAAEVVRGAVLTETERRQRARLIARVKDKGASQVVEEAAYTWFNRFTALRFLAVNGVRARVDGEDLIPPYHFFSDDKGAFHPEILTEALHLTLPGLSQERVFAYKEQSDDEGLFRYLLITECNALSKVLPGMFQKLDDETELLFPDHLLRGGSVIARMVSDIPEEDWKDQVQIIGWLYQYYNSEPKDQVFADLKKNKKITKEKIPAATQLFTPDWIVRYMVENSLGRLWLSGHPDDTLKGNWKYYLDEAEQEPEVEAQLSEIRQGYAKLTPEDLSCIDPCMGSGHILCYLFDVLMDIYRSYGYTARDAARLIVTKNLYGLDIDDRAAQLAYFAVMMKAVQYDTRFLSRGLAPHVYAIRDSRSIDSGLLHAFAPQPGTLRTQLEEIVSLFADAKETGSLIAIPASINVSALLARARELAASDSLFARRAEAELVPLLAAAELLARSYSAAVTNPPYMTSSNMSGKLSDYVKKHYPEGKADLFAAFMERCGTLTAPRGFQAMITQHSWMFLSSFEKLRRQVLSHTLINMAHLGARAFADIGGEVVQTTAFVLSPARVPRYRGTYVRLIAPTSEEGKRAQFLAGTDRYAMGAENFAKIPGSPVAYWVIPQVLEDYLRGIPLGNLVSPRKGNSTSNNARFLRLWYEIDRGKFNLGAKEIIPSETKIKRWYPYNKGGSYRKWYGNNEYLIDWYDDAAEIRKIPTAVIANYQYFMKPGLTWSTVSSGNFSVRLFNEGFIFDNGGCCVFDLGQKRPYYMALLNSNTFKFIFGQLNPTLNFQSGEVAKFPVIYAPAHTIDELSMKNYYLACRDWDSFETSWDFAKSPLLPAGAAPEGEAPPPARPSGSASRLSDCWERWKDRANRAFAEMKRNEEELNRIFIGIYGLQDELTPEESNKDVTIHYLVDKKEDAPDDMGASAYLLTKEAAAKQFISYGVGCLFGRYSLDVPGLAYAGGEWDASKYKTFQPDADGIIPISDDEYFPDDMVGRFVAFVGAAYGKEKLEENLRWLADALGGKGSPREVLRRYFLGDFYKDHCRMYQKRPIYWLFDSGKKNGFKCLIYMHRYRPDTLARIRTDYVHEQQARYRTAMDDLTRRVSSASSTAEKVRLEKQLRKVKDQAEEARMYEEKIHHLADRMTAIDLDDGVKVNYAKFADVLAKVK